MAQGSSTPRSWDTKTLAWSCIGSFALGAVLLYGAGFHWLGQWQTGEAMQKRQAVAACVQDFLLQPDRGLIYVQLKETTSSYQRRQLIRERKLAPSFEIAEQCGEHIRAFDPASFEPPTEANAEEQAPA